MSDDNLERDLKRFIADELPRTASGKIDRLSLESFSSSRMDCT